MTATVFASTLFQAIVTQLTRLYPPAKRKRAASLKPRTGSHQNLCITSLANFTIDSGGNGLAR